MSEREKLEVVLRNILYYENKKITALRGAGGRMEDMEKVLAFVNDQKDHETALQMLVFRFCNELMDSAMKHDRSKWSDLEMPAFIESRDSLRGSTDGKDEEYQKHFKSEAIQHHVKNNPHHPEFWDESGRLMPLTEIILMFFDWQSRSIQKGSGMDGFWDYNLKKLSKQSHAVPIVETMRRDFT